MPFLRSIPLLAAVLLAALALNRVSAQDRFPDPIPALDFVAKIETVATVPDSTPGQPPRISVLTQDPSGRLFANDQRGPLYLINSSDQTATECLDIRDFPELDIRSTFEAGFQGFAFHPDFHSEGAPGYGKLYTIHSSANTAAAPDFDPGGSTNFHTLLLEWQTNTPEAALFTPANPQAPYREILRFKQPFGNHNAGLIAFNTTATSQDSDYGNLYIALGDGGSGGDPQENGEDPSNPFGAILRIDPLGTNSQNGKYGIVAENVLASDNNPTTIPEIYCYGLRNPQRFGWDPATGKAYIADIGQNAVEEINLAVNGGNFGWDEREGSFPFEGGSTPNLIDPIAEYDHTNPVSNPSVSLNNRAVTIGEVARDTGIPALEGQLMISDFPTGLVFVLDVDNDPLDGGQDGLRELRFRVEEDDQPQRFLDLINAARAARGLSNASRADTRFSVGTPGTIYITNKQDGIIRRLVPEVSPVVTVHAITDGGLSITFVGTLQTSADLITWTTLQSATTETTALIPAPEAIFIRSL